MSTSTGVSEDVKNEVRDFLDKLPRDCLYDLLDRALAHFFKVGEPDAPATLRMYVILQELVNVVAGMIEMRDTDKLALERNLESQKLAGDDNKLVKALVIEEQELRDSIARHAAYHRVWFAIPIKSLTTVDYVTFVYLYMEHGMNPLLRGDVTKTVKSSDGNDTPTTQTFPVYCTESEAWSRFAWIHKQEPRLETHLQQLLAPVFINGVDEYHVADIKDDIGKIRANMKACLERWNTELDAHVARILVDAERQGVTDPDELKRKEKEAHMTYQSPLLRGDESSLRQFAKKLKVSFGILYLVYTWIKDMQADELRKAKEKQLAKHLGPKGAMNAHDEMPTSNDTELDRGESNAADSVEVK